MYNSTSSSYERSARRTCWQTRCLLASTMTCMCDYSLPLMSYRTKSAMKLMTKSMSTLCVSVGCFTTDMTASRNSRLNRVRTRRCCTFMQQVPHCLNLLKFSYCPPQQRGANFEAETLSLSQWPCCCHRRTYQVCLLGSCHGSPVSLPHSNADCERICSMVRMVHTETRKSLHADTITALLQCRINFDSHCYDFTITPVILHEAKKCTHEYNVEHPTRD